MVLRTTMGEGGGVDSAPGLVKNIHDRHLSTVVINYSWLTSQTRGFVKLPWLFSNFRDNKIYFLPEVYKSQLRAEN